MQQLRKLTTKRLSDDCVDLKNYEAEKADYSLRYPHLHRNGQDWFYISECSFLEGDENEAQTDIMQNYTDFYSFKL